MAAIDLGILSAQTQYTESVSLLETNDIFSFSLAGSSELVFSIPSELDWVLREQGGSLISQASSEFVTGEVTLTGLSEDTEYALEVGRRDVDLNYMLTIAPGDSSTTDPLTGEPSDIPTQPDGTFQIGESGEVGFEYVLDGGAYQGEAGIVSLSGLESFEWGSVSWTEEIVRRVLSNSTQGYRLVDDRVDNPWLPLFEDEEGVYPGRQTFQMTPGDTVAIVVIPDGTFAEVLANPGIGGNKRPLFSIATANPDDAFHLGQIAVAGQDVYVMEDQRVDRGSDSDYNDFGFRLTGVTPRGIGSVDDFINIEPGEDDWRDEVPSLVNVAPVVEFEVAGLESREFPLTGAVTDANGEWDIASLAAEVVNASGAVVRTIELDLAAGDGEKTFEIEREEVTGGLGAGTYDLKLKPQDLNGAGEAVVAIAIDIESTDPIVPAPVDPDPINTAPTVPVLDALESSYQRGTTLTIAGRVTDVDGWNDIEQIAIELLDESGNPIGDVTTVSPTESGADTASFTASIALAETLAAGDYSVRVMATDAAGATSPIASPGFVVTIPPEKPPKNGDPDDPPPGIQRPNLLKFATQPLYTTDETIRISNARTADPDGWSNIAKVDFAWVDASGQVVDIARDVTEFRDGGDGTARFDFEIDLSGLMPGQYQLWGRVSDYNPDDTVSDAYFQEISQPVWILSGDGDTTLSNQVRWGLADRAGLADDPEVLTEAATGWVVWLTPGTDVEAVKAAIGANSVAATSLENTWAFELDGSQTNQAVRDTVLAIDGVELAYPDVEQKLFYHSPPGQHTDLLFEDQWSLQTGAAGVWGGQTIADIWEDFNVLGDGVQIAFIDGGFKVNDREFKDRVTWTENFTEGSDGLVGQVNRYDGDPSPISDDSQVEPRPGQVFPEDDRLSYEVYVPALGSLTELSVELNLAAGLEEDELDLLEDLNIKLHVPSANARILDFKDRIFSGFWGWRPGWGGDDADVPPHVFAELSGSELDGRTYTLLEPPELGNIEEFLRYFEQFSRVANQAVGGSWTISFGSDELADIKPYEALIERAIESVTLELDYADTHGTAVMSIAVAGVGDGSEKSILGGAPEAEIAAIQLIGELNPLTQSYGQNGRKIGDALSELNKDNSLSIVNNSWGTEPFAHFPLATGALQSGFENGADGLGTVYVWSGGNDRAFWPGIGQLGQYELNASRFGISVGAAAFDGDRWFATDYSNQGVFISAPSSANIGAPEAGEFDGRLRTLSGQEYDRYSTTFSGTSAAAPTVSAVVGLLRDYNPALTARDIQHILAETARPIETDYNADSTALRPLEYFDEDGDRQTARVPENWFDANHNVAALGLDSLSAGWQVNGAGKAFSLRHGFGLMDAYAAMELANPETYELLPELVSSAGDDIPTSHYVGETIPDGGSISVSDGNPGRQLIDEDITVEWAEVSVATTHEHWGELTFVLESPSGTQTILKRAMADAIPLADGSSLPVDSLVLNPGQGWVTDEAEISSKRRDWTFATPFFRGESALGDWTLHVFDEHDNDVSGELIDWSLEAFGTQPSVSVEATDSSAIEGGDGALLTFTRSGDISKPLAVELDWENAAEATWSGGALPGAISFAAGASTIELPIAAIEDGIDEGVELLTVSIVDDSALRLGDASSASVSISDAGLRLDPVDYAALKALYEGTDGENWQWQTGWSTWDFGSELPPLVSSVEDWHGVDTQANHVTSLDLSNNWLKGEIPSEIGDLSELKSLDFFNSQISGEIPTELGRLSNLSFLELSNNNLSGAIPEELGNLSSLNYFYLNYTEVSGGIPEELGELSNLYELRLTNNSLSGEIPSALSTLSELRILNLSRNNLNGEIPSEIGNLSKLEWLSLSDTDLSGEIPSEIGNLSKLNTLSLTNNNLSGKIPAELGNLSELERLYLASNDFSGEIPAELGSLSNLFRMHLDNNSLSGEIPPDLGELSNLYRLHLNDNELSGKIPSDLLELRFLHTLHLQNNNLTGEIPSGLIKPFAVELINLTDVDLSNNKFWNPSLTVSSTNDTGNGSLRAAIEFANTTSGTDPIIFDIPTSDPGYNATTGTFTIQPLSALPTITDSIVIDGTSQGGYSDRPLVELDGSNAGAGVDGLLLNASDSIIRGLAVNRFGDEGIQAQGDNNTFSNNFLGTDPTGTVALGNTEVGLFISGGNANIVENNLISGNAGGFQTRGTNGVIRGNLIGTDITGTIDLGNNGNGVSIDTGASGNLFGGTSEADRNIVAGNDFHGILIDGSNNRIQGNYIGVDITGENALANERQGIRLSAASGGSGNLIGGTEAGAGNVIANGDRGIVVYADNTTIQGNLIGTDATGTKNFGSNSQAIRVEANGTIIGGTSAGAGNVISGSKTAQGVLLLDGSSTVQGNYIGTDITGTVAIPNALSGVYIVEVTIQGVER